MNDKELINAIAKDLYTTKKKLEEVTKNKNQISKWWIDSEDKVKELELEVNHIKAAYLEKRNKQIKNQK